MIFCSFRKFMAIHKIKREEQACDFVPEMKSKINFLRIRIQFQNRHFWRKISHSDELNFTRWSKSEINHELSRTKYYYSHQNTFCFLFHKALQPFIPFTVISPLEKYFNIELHIYNRFVLYMYISKYYLYQKRKVQINKFSQYVRTTDR